MRRVIDDDGAPRNLAAKRFVVDSAIHMQNHGVPRSDPRFRVSTNMFRVRVRKDKGAYSHGFNPSS
jgi:hypothetical protein